jgi:arabinoxylan arabinofuranohydrolase
LKSTRLKLYGAALALATLICPHVFAQDKPTTQPVKTFTLEGNPFFTDEFTTDPAPFVYKDTLYLYTGHDEAKGSQQYTMNNYLCFSTTDMKTWNYYGSPWAAKDYKWATGDAWAAQVIEKNGKFFWYMAVQHDRAHNGKAVGVAVSDSPLGPWKDALGKALVTEEMTKGRGAWDDIDPTVLTEEDGTTWIFWGNGTCYYAKLKANMIELDGEIQRTNSLQGYIEGPWVFKKDKNYYLVYASMKQGNETISYAMSDKITGPWTFKGEIVDKANNSFTTHPGIIEFKGQWYMFYHNGAVKRPVDGGGSFRRSVCIDYMYFNPDGTIKPVVQTKEGVAVPPVKP